MAVALWPILIAQQQRGGALAVASLFSYGGDDTSSYGGGLDGFSYSGSAGGFTYAGTASQTFTYGGES